MSNARGAVVPRAQEQQRSNGRDPAASGAGEARDADGPSVGEDEEERPADGTGAVGWEPAGQRDARRADSEFGPGRAAGPGHGRRNVHVHRVRARA